MSIRLSQDQKKAVDQKDGALLVVAGPGSGKTRVLTERIRRLLEEA
jgi:DNA helicase-2/ATP-dependent DNA helicase PcrA